MKVTLMQTDISWADPQENIRRNSARLDSLTGSPDLVVFPEMFSTGFATSPAGIAEKDGLTLSWMKTTAAERGLAIAGSIATEDNGLYFNRFHFVEPSGKVTSYDKRHLFSFSGEDRTYTPGKGKVVIEYAGVRILLQVCYDLRFPETSRNSLRPDGAADFDLILYVASWPVRRVGAWSALLKARAIENQCYVAGVNRVGSDPACEYTGATAAIDPFGSVIAEAVPGADDAVTFETDLAALASYRADFTALKDIIRP